MSLTNNKIKSTTIYGALNVVDMPDGSILADIHVSRDLLVDGKINNIPNATINHIANLTSDAQTQLTTLQNKTVGFTYVNGISSTYHANNLTVMGTINGVVFNS